KFIPGFVKDIGYTGSSSGASRSSGDSNNSDYNNLNLGNFDFGNFINSLTSSGSSGSNGGNMDWGSIIKAGLGVTGLPTFNLPGGNSSGSSGGSSSSSAPDWMKFLLPLLGGLGGGLSNRPSTFT